MESTARVRSFAKINLDLRVLNKRADGYHELRTVFQTISLADTIHIEYTRSQRTHITVEGNLDIPDNLVVRAAEAVFDATRAAGTVKFNLRKRIPIGAGLGGGSSNAAAVLLALPALAGKRLPIEVLRSLAEQLGSDVPFFLHGGAALGIGRGTELYPLPDPPALPGVLVAPGVHVSTADAYRGLERALTTTTLDFDTGSFQSFVWGLGEECPARDWRTLASNDFEGAVFRKYPKLKNIKQELGRSGARPAMMTGSGSALFGLYDSSEECEKAVTAFQSRPSVRRCGIFRISLVSRRRYQSIWRRQLGDHIMEGLWPPQSRYAK
jgi:4-diphosphocytidyl-2-C-methyl-D-erythritol kinase